MKKKDALWIRFEDHLLNEGISQSRIKKLFTMYNMAGRGLNCDFESAGRPEIEGFVTRVNRNEFKKVDGQNLSGNTKSDLKKFLRQFYKWLKGDNEEYPKEVSWIKTRISKDERPEEKPVIDVKQVKHLATKFNKIEYRILTLLLFDSGFRIREMLSVKKKDITWEEYQPGKSCFWLNCNKSKTYVRKVPVPLFTEDLQSFINSSYFEQLGDNDLVFNISYRTANENLRVASESIGIRLTPHALRHSSATYYARELDGNMSMLADRYGWAYNSKELATYIRRSGAYQKQQAKKVFTNELMKIKEEFNQYKENQEQFNEFLVSFITTLRKNPSLQSKEIVKLMQKANSFS